MPGDNYFYLAALPALGSLGTLPDFEFKELLQAQRSSPVGEALRVPALADDLLMWQQIHSGAATAAEPLVLPDWQLDTEELLVRFLGYSGDLAVLLREAGGLLGDMPWRLFFDFADRAARRLTSNFLQQWADFEVGLRRELRRGDLSSAVLSAGGAGCADPLLARVSVELARAEHPLAAWQLGERLRWLWLQEHDGYYAFSADEIVAYGAKLLLLQRWARVQRGQAVGEQLLDQWGLGALAA